MPLIVSSSVSSQSAYRLFLVIPASFPPFLHFLGTYPGKACSIIFAQYPAIWFPVRILSRDAHTSLGRQKCAGWCGKQTGGSRRLGAVTAELPAVLLQLTEIISIFISISIFLWLMHARSWISLTMPLSNMDHHVNNKLLNIFIQLDNKLASFLIGLT